MMKIKLSKKVFDHNLNEVIINDQKISIIGFYLLPFTMGNKLLNAKMFDLSEKCFFTQYKYSYKTFKNVINESNIVPYLIDKSSLKMDLSSLENINSFYFTEECIEHLKKDDSKKNNEFFKGFKKQYI